MCGENFGAADVASDFQADIDAVNAVSVVPTILDVVCRLTGMGFAAVARVTSDRWIACSVRDDIAFGLKPGGELEIATTICNEIRRSGEAVVIDHVAGSARWCSHPTPAMYGFQSYISMPIVLRDGSFFGTLCAIDPKPARLESPEIVGAFRMFADLIAFHLQADARLAASEASLTSERKTADLREQFIAVLGHDLRNPLASIAGGVRLLGKEPQSEKSRTILKMMQHSADRMNALISDVLDFARGRLGGGFAATVGEVSLVPVLTQVAGELSAAHPEAEIDAQFAVSRPVRADPARIGQLFSNLLGNALVHGGSGTPVAVRATTEDGVFELSVSNRGTPIPADILAHLFEPFVRGKAGGQPQGLGLGLYIASQIAKAHGGTLTAASTPEETRFTFRMPL
jgi:signal transduction histidine kinase